MIKNNIYKIIFAILIIVCLYAIFISCKSLSVARANEINTNEQMLIKEISFLKKEIKTLEEELKQTQGGKELHEENAYKLTSEEREIVERVVAAEARGEGLKGQMAVANVIKDRAELWNMTPKEVVTAKGQFAEPYQGEISEDTKLAVEIVFDKGIRVFEDYVTHFASNNPWWAENKTVRGAIGVHTFYY